MINEQSSHVTYQRLSDVYQQVSPSVDFLRHVLDEESGSEEESESDTLRVIGAITMMLRVCEEICHKIARQSNSPEMREKLVTEFDEVIERILSIRDGVDNLRLKHGLL